MDTITLRLHELGPDLIRDLKQRYETAIVEITVNDQAAYTGAMDESRFWSIIALFDWTKTGNDDAVIEPAVQMLAEMTPEDIIHFFDILSKKLWQLDTEAHARPFTDKHPKGYLSVDDFLYVRCCVVANGEEVFKQILHHPDNIPDLAFSRLLHLASKAYERRTGRIINHIPAYNYETYSNENGWI